MLGAGHGQPCTRDQMAERWGRRIMPLALSVVLAIVVLLESSGLAKYYDAFLGAGANERLSTTYRTFRKLQQINLWSSLQHDEQLMRRKLWSIFESGDPKSVTSKKKKMDLGIADEALQTTLNSMADEAVARGRTAFYVILPPKAESASDRLQVLIEVVNPKMNCQYSVTVTSHDIYTGTATLVPSLGHDHHTYIWEPNFPGRYEVFVHELNHNHPPLSSKFETALIQSPYPIHIWGATELDMLSLNERIRDMTPCQQLPEVNVYSHWDGDWLGPAFKLDNSLRNGWTFLPNGDGMDCKIDTFTSRDLGKIPKKVKVYVMGNSIMRGVFLSLVDLMLPVKDKVRLKDSIIGKCWGRASVTRGNLEVIYQDFRSNNFEDMDEPANIICHNDKLAKQLGTSFIQNATQVWKEIFQQEKEWPAVILMLGGNYGRFLFNDGKMTHHHNPNPKWKVHLKWFVNNMPPTWHGTLIFGDNSLSARVAGLADTAEYSSYLAEIEGLLDELNDPRIRWLDGHGMSKEMRMYGEEGEKHIAESQHFHSYCNRNRGIVVCSNVTDMIGQILLGHAIGPKGELNKAKQMTRKWWKRYGITRWCHRCPKCLVPSSIIPNPEMTCMQGQLNAKTKMDVCSSTPDRDRPDCPSSCMSTPWKGKFGAESNMVYVRQCPL